MSPASSSPTPASSPATVTSSSDLSPPSLMPDFIAAVLVPRERERAVRLDRGGRYGVALGLARRLRSGLAKHGDAVVGIWTSRRSRIKGPTEKRRRSFGSGLVKIGSPVDGYVGDRRQSMGKRIGAGSRRRRRDVGLLEGMAELSVGWAEETVRSESTARCGNGQDWWRRGLGINAVMGLGPTQRCWVAGGDELK
ncbi:hypothetical protein M0R45_030874 [Rubus argutus]|uniref:Uncharacterized protein n=1 Tax=Rubus argutus TaxID=59490 RepID=A0AAW1WFV4_RUBAR